jgi:hypothetical protein
MTPPPRYHLQRLAVFVLLILGAGCTDYDKSTNPTFVPPMVVSEAPPTGAGGVCPSTVVPATFRRAMNPANIKTTTFTLTTGTPAVAVDGVVTNAASRNTEQPARLESCPRLPRLPIAVPAMLREILASGRQLRSLDFRREH